MYSHASGAAVLLWGADVAVSHLSICQGLTQKSCLSGLMPSLPNVRMYSTVEAVYFSLTHIRGGQGQQKHRVLMMLMQHIILPIRLLRLTIYILWTLMCNILSSCVLNSANVAWLQQQLIQTSTLSNLVTWFGCHSVSIFLIQADQLLSTSRYTQHLHQDTSTTAKAAYGWLTWKYL